MRQGRPPDRPCRTEDQADTGRMRPLAIFMMPPPPRGGTLHSERRPCRCGPDERACAMWRKCGRNIRQWRLFRATFLAVVMF